MVVVIFVFWFENFGQIICRIVCFIMLWWFNVEKGWKYYLEIIRLGFDEIVDQ